MCISTGKLQFKTLTFSSSLTHIITQLLRRDDSSNLEQNAHMSKNRRFFFCRLFSANLYTEIRRFTRRSRVLYTLRLVSNFIPVFRLIVSFFIDQFLSIASRLDPVKSGGLPVRSMTTRSCNEIDVARGSAARRTCRLSPHAKIALARGWRAQVGGQGGRAGRPQDHGGVRKGAGGSGGRRERGGTEWR